MRSKYSNSFHFILALLFLGTFYPFVHNYVLFGTQKALVSLIALGIWTISILIRKHNNLILPKKAFNLIVFIQIIFILFWSFVIDSQGIRAQATKIALSWVIIVLVLNSIDTKYFLKTFTKLNIISLILCIIGIILVMSGITSLVSTHVYQSDKIIYNYVFFFIKRSDLTYLNIRPSGYYDEPGSFAYVVMLLLLLNRKFFKNIKWEYALLVLPLVTTSLAHIVTATLFLIIYYTNIKSIRYIIIIISISAVLLFAFNSFQKTEYGQYFSSKTIDRIEKIIEGEGDSGRSGGLDLGPKIFKDNYLGVSPETVKIKFPDFVNETFWAPLIYYGIFGIGFFYLPFIYIFIKIIKTRDKEDLLAFILLMFNLLQRPNYAYPLFILLIYYLFFTPKKELIT